MVDQFLALMEQPGRGVIAPRKKEGETASGGVVRCKWNFGCRR